MKAEQKEITFRRFAKFCDQRYPLSSGRGICCHNGEGPGCRARNCPVWKRLKKAISKDMKQVIEMGLCEVQHIMLRPNQLYRFVVMPDCEKCKALDVYSPNAKPGERPPQPEETTDA